LPLRRGAEQADGARSERLHGEGEIGEPIMARERFAHDAERAHVKRDRRIGVDGGMHEPTVAAELPHKFAARRIDIAVVDR
jgi:hypothetical protein